MPLPERLVVLGSTLTALAVVRAARALALPTILVDVRRAIAFDSRLPLQKYLVSGDDDGAVLARLAQARAGARTALIADSDAWLRFVVRQRAALDALFEEVLHPDSAAIETCLDKTRFLRWCAEHGFAAPRQYVLQPDGSLQPAPTFPLLLRPETTRHGSGIKVPKAVEATQPESLARWIAVYQREGVTPSIAQSLLRPRIRQYSIGLVRNRSGVVRSVVAEKVRSLPEQCAGGTYVVLSRQDDALALAVRAIEALDYHGIAEVEILRDDASGECFLIEINARPWVQLGLAEKAGLNLLAFALGVYHGENLGRPTRWLNFEADLHNCLARDGGSVRTGRISWWSYVGSLVRANAFAVWDRSDPMPFARSTWRMAAGLLG